MEMDMKHGLMVQATRVPIKMVKSMDKVFLLGQTDPLTTAVLWTTILKVTVFTIGKMVEFSKVNGLTIKCMELESLIGQMVEDMKVSTKMTRKKGRVYSSGQMDVNMTGNGLTVNKMVSVSTQLQTESKEQENGKMESVSLG
jgi:hypothetical protein